MRESALLNFVLSINGYFHGLLLSLPTFNMTLRPFASVQSCSNCIGLLFFDRK